ncbi:hypothetical protein WKT22_04701 [Candidatus Lokiarchaeum ossiferum]
MLSYVICRLRSYKTYFSIFSNFFFEKFSFNFILYVSNSVGENKISSDSKGVTFYLEDLFLLVSTIVGIFMYTLAISKSALAHILTEGKENYQNNFALVLADTSCCSGMISIEIGSEEVISKDVNMQLLFPKETTGNSFHVYAENQAIREDAFPENILIDLNPSADRKVLEIKNGHFETPYEDS